MALTYSVERFCANPERYVGKRKIGLITNPSGIDGKLISTVDRLFETGQLVALFGPEHGVRGDIEAGEKVTSFQDPTTGLPVHSLYGATKKPTAEMLVGVEALVFDLQDVGCRFYTYLYTMLYVLEAAKEFGLPLVVLDRPNPLGGVLVEGNVLDPEYTSFVGHPIPVRYGMTIGEMALYFNTAYEIGAELQVITMEGWERNSFGDSIGVPWVAPSPNIPTMETALVYPGMCFIEGTNLSEGRGTTKPFEIMGAPFINGGELARNLNALHLPGVGFRPTSFTPTFSKHKGVHCQGVQVHVLDRQDFRPVETGLRLIETVAHMYSHDFAFIEPPAGRKFFFDLLAGTSQIRQYINKGQSVETLFPQWEEDRRDFMKQRESFLLY